MLHHLFLGSFTVPFFNGIKDTKMLMVKFVSNFLIGVGLFIQKKEVFWQKIMDISFIFLIRQAEK